MNLVKELNALENNVHTSSITSAFVDVKLKKVIEKDNFLTKNDKEIVLSVQNTISMDSNVLIQKLIMAKCPFVPPITVTCGQLGRTFAGSSDFDKENSNLINYQKFDLIFKVCDSFEKNLSKKFNITSISQVQEKISNLPKYSQDECDNLIGKNFPALFVR